jgi:hypothetical protein
MVRRARLECGRSWVHWWDAMVSVLASLDRNQDKCQSVATFLSADCCFRELAPYKST